MRVGRRNDLDVDFVDFSNGLGSSVHRDVAIAIIVVAVVVVVVVGQEELLDVVLDVGVKPLRLEEAFGDRSVERMWIPAEVFPRKRIGASQWK